VLLFLRNNPGKQEVRTNDLGTAHQMALIFSSCVLIYIINIMESGHIIEIKES
jgi:hypothetical protein